MKNDLNNIQKSRLFIGSGVDDLVDEDLHTRLDEFGQYHVDYNDTKSDNIMKTAMNTRGSRNEDNVAEEIFSETPGIRHNDKLGYYLDLYVGYVTKNNFRKDGSSGGFVSWLASKLLESGKINGYIHVKKSEKSGILFEYGISRTVNEIKSGAKSRYYPAELSEVLKEVKNKPGKYAVVGIPEIITELRLLAENDLVIKDRIKYYFGLVAGHQKTTKYAEAIAWEYGIKPGNLEDIDFRVKKESGTAIEYDMKFTGKIDGEKRTFIVRNNEPFVSSWAHGFFKARFSDFTDNTFNEVADITFGDAWLDEYVGDPMGNNILIIRNQEIANIIKNGDKDGEIEVDKVDEEVVNRSQQGLIHHTRDELPYRLHKEIKKYGWAPIKRVKPSDVLNIHRKKVQDVRQDIVEKSQIYYKDAVARNDFDYFRAKMQPFVDKYKKLYNQPITFNKTKKVKADGAILTLTGYFNYGNVLQRYALQKFLRQSGYNFVSYVDPYSAPQDMYRIGKKVKVKTPLRAVRRFFNYQKPYWYIPKHEETYPEAHRLENIINFVNRNIWIKPFNPNDNYKNYIVGSDQVWRDWWNNRETLGYYFFNFLKGRKVNRIAYAASFGKDKIDEVIKREDLEYIKPYIEAFNKISVREKSGIEMVNKAWGLKNVEEVIDPTLLLNKTDYSKLINKSDCRYEKIQPIFSYILGETPELKDFVKKIQDERRHAVTRIRAHEGAENDTLPPVELWLKGFRDAELVVTNSFHGMIFSIINNTNFIIIGKESGGLSRIADFLLEFDIVDRFVSESELADFNYSNIKSIDWKRVNNKLKKLQKESSDWLLDALK